MAAEIVDLAGFGYERGMSQARGTKKEPVKANPRLVLEVRHLKLIQAIAREGSVTRAAPSLNLSQSALSHQLLHLERDLGAKLFDRVGKRMVPTSAGALVLETAADVLGRLTQTERAVRQPNQERATLRVAAGCFTYYQWLAGALARFGAEQPDVDVQIALGGTRRELQAVVEDEVDLAVTSDGHFDERFERRSLFKLDLVGVIGSSHALSAARTVRRPGIRWDDLKSETILIHELGDSDVKRLTTALTGDRPPRLWRVQLTEAIFELARAGHGIGVMTHWPQAAPPPAEVSLVPLIPRREREFWAVWRRGNPRGLPLEALARQLSGDLSARRMAAS